MKKFSKAWGVISLVSLCFSIIGPGFVAQAAIASTDYFQLTTAGNAVTMDAGGSLVFTINAKVANGAAKTLAGADFALINIWPLSGGLGGAAVADVTAIGGGATLKASATDPMSGGTTAADIAGASDDLVAINIDGTGTGTFTVTGTSSFGVCVSANGAAINPPDTGDFGDGGAISGQDCRSITVAAASTGADHVEVSFVGGATASVGDYKTMVLTQVNLGGGLVTSALADVVVDLSIISISLGAQSGLIKSSVAHGLEVNDLVKFTSSPGAPTAYYVVSSVDSVTTFKVDSANGDGAFSNSNVIKVGSLTPTGSSYGLDGGNVVTANVASVLQLTETTSGISQGSVVALSGLCTGNYLVTNVVNNGAASTVTVIGPTACTTDAGTITKQTPSDGPAGAYVVHDAAGAEAYIYSVGGELIGNQTTTYLADVALVNGVLDLVVVPTSTGTLAPLAASMGTLGGELGIGSLTVGAASALTINSYGPPNGQIGVPVHAPIDVMFNKNPDPLGTIFPLTNTTSSQLAFISGDSAVSGVWDVFIESGWGSTYYRAIFKPSVPLSASTSYTAKISDDLVSAISLPGGMPALTDGGAFNSFSFTTGLSGGSFTAPAPGDSTGAGGFVSGFTGTFGGEFPPMAFLSYPQPRSAAVPTNIACVTVEFDRPMKASTLTTSNIYIRKLTAGVESTPAGTPVVTPLEGNESACVSGYTFEANSKYRVVVSRSVTDEKGTQLAGMPESDGAAISGIGFGFENMGPFREEFTTGAGVAAAIAPNLMGLNLNQYKSAGSITGVPTGSIVKASFGQPLNPSTVNAQNITLKRGGSIPIEGSVFYDAMGNSVEFVPTSALSASVAYTFAISSSVTSVTGTAISPLTTVFTTGVADVIKPKLVFADADNYGVHLQFDETLLESTATDKTNYTIKTCSQAAIAADGTSCTGGGAVTTVSLFSGVTAHYERTENAVWMDGLTLTAGDGFYIAVGTGVTDVAGNAVHATDNKSWTGTVMGADKFAGGQGMFNMGTIGMEDFDMKVMGMKPINAMPMNTMAGATTKYFINIPIGTAIPTGGYVELTFPAGFVVTGVKRDAQSPMNADFNGPSTGIVTFAEDLPTITGLTDGAGAQGTDGVGYVTAARKVIVKLSGATQASDFLHIDLDGITNSSEPKSFDTSGYSINIKTFNTSNVLLEAMTTMPFFISSAGTGSVAGQVGVGMTGLNDVVVFLHSPMTGPMQTVTSADGAGVLVPGADDGEYKFENLPAGQYFISTEPLFTSGVTEYYGNSMPEPVTVSGAVTKDVSVTAATATGKATQPVGITFPSLASVSSLGFSDSIDIFAFNPGSRVPVIKTVTRDTLGASPYSVNLYLPVAGDWNIGIGPAMPRGPGAAGKGEVGGWMPSQNVVVNIAAADLGGAAKSAIALSMGVSNKSITGKVLDGSGTAVANAEVYAYDPQAGKNAHTTAKVDGTFSLSVTEGSYKVGAFLPGMPSSQETPVRVGASAVYVNGSTTASTGSSGAAPLYLRVSVPDYTIQGRVATSGGSPIAGSAVWAHRTDAPSRPLNAITDSSGNYSFYVTAGTWKVEGDAPNYGYLGSKTIVVTTASLSSQNFEVASTLNTVSGTINIPATSDDSGTIVYAYGVNGSAEAKTDTNGNYTLNLPDGTYDISAVVPGMGDLEPLEAVVVNGTEVGNDFTVATPRTFTITLSEEATVDTTIGLFNESGRGNEILIPAGSTSGTITVPEGTYYLDADVAGADFEDLTISGAEFNIPNGAPSTNDQVNIDGTGDNVTITLPEIFTITGQVTVDGEGVNDAYVSIFDEATKSVFGVMTANDAASGGLDGEYSIRVQAGTYSIAVDKSGYTTTPIDLTVTANAADNDFVLTASSLTITGTVYDGETPVAGAPVWAEKAGGGFVATETSTDGTYVLNVDSGVWVVNGVSDGYAAGDALTVDVSTSQTLQDFSLTELSGEAVLGDPQTESITPGTGGTIVDENTSVEVVIPPNALGTSSDSGQISVAETNAVMQTATSNPIGNGVEVSALDNDGNPITTLSDDVTIVLPITLAALVAEGVDTPAELSGMRNAYWDDSAATWASLPTDTIYYNASREVIPENTVAAAETLAAAGVATVELTSRVSHFTTFASIVSSGATPPATPTGLAATAGDGQVALTWTKNGEEDMSSYNIWEANVTEGILTTSLQSACGVTTCSKTITGLTNGTAYAFQIAAVDTPDGNTSAYATAVNATPAAVSSSSAGGGGVVLNRNNSSATTEATSEADVVDGEVPVGGVGVVYGQTPFVDISSHWAKDYIEALYLNKIVSGSDASHFNPENTTTRAELTKMVVNAFGISLPSEMPANFFSDVEFSKWYASYVAAAKNEGFVVGYSDNTFKPNGVINRAEAIKLLVTALGVDLSGVTGGSFPDVKASDWYSTHASYAAENGIVVGDENGKFSAAGSLTRAMAAKMISLILEKKQ